MGKSIVGSIIAVRFPFSDLSSAKLRPALVLAEAEFGNLIVCQITSKTYTSKSAVKITPSDTSGMLRESYIRPDKIFTAAPEIVSRELAKLDTRKHVLVRDHLRILLGL